MAKYETVDLTKEENVLVITSTYGDGDPPDNAQAFWNYLKAIPYRTLPHLNYSVLALGDTNYSAFCQFGGSGATVMEAIGTPCPPVEREPSTHRLAPAAPPNAAPSAVA